MNTSDTSYKYKTFCTQYDTYCINTYYVSYNTDNSTNNLISKNFKINYKVYYINLKNGCIKDYD